MKKIGLLAIAIVAFVSGTVSAVPRYSAIVPQVGDSSDAATVQQVDGKMNDERGGVEKETMIDALKGCRDGATIGIVSGSFKGGVVGGVAGGLPGAAAGAAMGAASGAAEGCVNGMITGVAKGAVVRTVKDKHSADSKTDGKSSVLDKITPEQGVCKVQELEVPVNAIEVDSVKSGDGGTVKVTAMFDDHRGEENEQISEWKSSNPNVIRVNNALNRDALSRKIDMFKAILHESRHKWNYENVAKVCKGIGKDECDLYDELTAFMAEGKTKVEAVNHLLEKYPEFVSAIEDTMGMCAKPGICTAPSEESGESAVVPESGTVSNRVEVANPAPAAVADSSVGVRGWCGCGDDHGKLYEAGYMFAYVIMGGVLHGLGLVKKGNKAERTDNDTANKMLLDARYTYVLCAKCGKCRRPSADPDTVSYHLINWKDEWVIRDNILELSLKADKDLTTAQHVRKKLEPQKEFLKKVPNGGIVFPGVCACKVPDPVHVGFLESDYSPYVCLLCGHVRLPDENGGMPNGPTALEEMGLGDKAKEEEKLMDEWLTSILQ